MGKQSGDPGATYWCGINSKRATSKFSPGLDSEKMRSYCDLMLVSSCRGIALWHMGNGQTFGPRCLQILAFGPSKF
ncbi:uncharacterized protein J3R85_013479 [Psidium guajava]|nr:uncharacterized protein J3R85_013479 [Psidium guajava]